MSDGDGDGDGGSVGGPGGIGSEGGGGGLAGQASAEGGGGGIGSEGGGGGSLGAAPAGDDSDTSGESIGTAALAAQADAAAAMAALGYGPSMTDAQAQAAQQGFFGQTAPFGIAAADIGAPGVNLAGPAPAPDAAEPNAPMDAETAQDEADTAAANAKAIALGIMNPDGTLGKNAEAISENAKAALANQTSSLGQPNNSPPAPAPAPASTSIFGEAPTAAALPGLTAASIAAMAANPNASINGVGPFGNAPPGSPGVAALGTAAGLGESVPGIPGTPGYGFASTVSPGPSEPPGSPNNPNSVTSVAVPSIAAPASPFGDPNAPTSSLGLAPSLGWGLGQFGYGPFGMTASQPAVTGVTGFSPNSATLGYTDDPAAQDPTAQVATLPATPATLGFTGFSQSPPGTVGVAAPPASQEADPASLAMPTQEDPVDPTEIPTPFQFAPQPTTVTTAPLAPLAPISEPQTTMPTPPVTTAPLAPLAPVSTPNLTAEDLAPPPPPPPPPPVPQDLGKTPQALIDEAKKGLEDQQNQPPAVVAPPAPVPAPPAPAPAPAPAPVAPTPPAAIPAPAPTAAPPAALPGQNLGFTPGSNLAGFGGFGAGIHDLFAQNKPLDQPQTDPRSGLDAPLVKLDKNGNPVLDKNGNMIPAPMTTPAMQDYLKQLQQQHQMGTIV